ncbi:MAG: 3-dehydroquinate synthase [Deltaproteobacteria bacterium RIFCSPHIGHO2_02_FULL_40_11]|nr:MAG: 3-dehydroquinate synthase [Deltaproteobacteria bacterium RIFCSPHIGHO2_02_FULL_40_11]
MKILKIKAQNHTYPVWIDDQKILRNLKPHLEKYIPNKRALFFMSKNLEKFYGPRIRGQFDSSWNIKHIAWEDTEKNKAFSHIEPLCKKLLSLGVDRYTTLIGVGGGVVGDMAAFLASIYMRGLNYIALPTTLISQTDSSIGGKCGVNLADGKNLIGSFYHPRAVFIDTSFLKTLPQEHYQSGLAEVIKYAFIDSASNLYGLLQKNKRSVLARTPDILKKIVFYALKTKKQFIEKDERDHSVRQLLNFGHTYGHALETLDQYASITHGSAIAQGMYIATALSLKEKICSPETATKVKMLLKEYGFEEEKTNPNALKNILNDKKRNGENLNWILLEDIGQAKIHSLNVRATNRP